MSATTAKRVHWTQKPENAEKVRTMNRRSVATKRARGSIKLSESEHVLVRQYETLKETVRDRIIEIDNEMQSLMLEKERLIKLFGNGHDQ